MRQWCCPLAFDIAAELVPYSLSTSKHTKHALEELHENISVIRHPVCVPGAPCLRPLADSPLFSTRRTTAAASWCISGAITRRLSSSTTRERPPTLPYVYIDADALRSIACIGGLDLCYGRWDTHNFQMADVHPSDVMSLLQAGQDYNNARVADFERVDAWAGNQQNRLSLGRMPWHDVHTMIVGPAVMDIAQFFVERWNFVRCGASLGGGGSR